MHIGGIDKSLDENHLSGVHRIEGQIRGRACAAPSYEGFFAGINSARRVIAVEIPAGRTDST